jgi:hypothetical protein
MEESMHRIIASVVLGLGLGTGPAHAGAVVGLQTEYAAPLEANDGPAGLGLSGRVGYGVDLGLFSVVPEMEVAKFSDIWVPKIGGRVQIGKGLEPGIYGHLLLPLWRQASPVRGWDAGVVLDITAAPMIDVGIHGGAMVLDKAPRRTVIPVFGVHASVAF